MARFLPFAKARGGFMELLCVLLMQQLRTQSTYAQHASTYSWNQAKYAHTPRTVASDELEAIANLPEVGRQSTVTFENLLDPILIPRVPGTENHAKVKAYLKEYMKNLGWTVEGDAFEDATPYGKKPFENIIATLNPNVPRRLVLACHYDSKYFREDTFVGATDSAVPCAMLLDLATRLKPQLDDFNSYENQKVAGYPNQNVTLQFLFFDGEEAFRDWTDTDSLYGARHLAAKWQKTPYPPGQTTTNYLDRIDLIMLLDLLGTPNPTIYSFFDATSHLHTNMVNIEKALRSARLWSGQNTRSSYFRPQASYSGIADDHIPFLRRGVSILHVIPTPFPSVWHKETDDKDALDFNTIDNLNRILRVWVTSYLHLPPPKPEGPSNNNNNGNEPIPQQSTSSNSGSSSSSSDFGQKPNQKLVSLLLVFYIVYLIGTKTF